MYDSPLDSQLTIQPVNVTPFQCECLADSQTEADTDKRYHMERFFKLSTEPVELVRGQATLGSHSLCRARDCNEFHRTAARYVMPVAPSVA
jgi:hypothetical protein